MTDVWGGHKVVLFILNPAMDSRGDAETRRRQEVEPKIDVHQVGDPSMILVQRERTVFSAPPREKIQCGV